MEEDTRFQVLFDKNIIIQATFDEENPTELEIEPKPKAVDTTKPTELGLDLCPRL